MDSLVSTFHIDWKIIIAQLANFAIVIGVVYFFVLKPLTKIMKERSLKIEGGVRDARINAELLSTTKLEYDKIITEARKEALVIFNEGKEKAENQREAMLAQTKQEVTDMIEKGKKTLESEKSKMIEDAKKELVHLVVGATSQLLETESSPELEKKVVLAVNNL